MTRHDQSTLALLACTGAVLTASGLAHAANPWVAFEDDTANRLVAADDVGAGDTEQKDYAWGDIDNDGDTDLIVARKQPWTSPGKRTNVLLMNEDGVLVDRTSEFASASDFEGDQGFLTPTNDRDVQLADFNNDGWLDVVTAVFSLSPGDADPKHISHPRIYMNLGADGQGAWLGLRHEDARIPQLHPTADPRYYSVSTGDIDNDGDTDLFFSDGDNGGAQLFDFNNRLLINDGAGFFTDETDARLTEEMSNSAWGISSAIADMNLDGALDIVKHSAVVQPFHVAIIYNDPQNPGFFDGFDVIINSLSPTHISVADLNNDTLPDIIETDDGVDRFLIYVGLNDSGQADFTTKTFQFPGSFDDGFGGNNIGADLNNDGFNDVIITDVDFDIAGCNRRTHIFHNQGDTPLVTIEEEVIDGTVAGIPTQSLKGTHDAAVFDIDGDGLLDMVLGQCTGTRVFINVTTPPVPCPADLDESGLIDSADLNALLAAFGCTGGGCDADIDNDGDTDSADLNALLGAFGRPCP